MSGADESADRLRAEGLAPSAWSNGPGDRYGAHEHDYDKVIAVESGSIRFGLVDRGEISRARRGRPPRAAGLDVAIARSSGRPASRASRRTSRRERSTQSLDSAAGEW